MRESASTPPDPAMDIELVVARRRSRIRQAHASNLIEGQDMGEPALSDLLDRAGAPIPDDDFADAEVRRLLATHAAGKAR